MDEVPLEIGVEELDRMRRAGESHVLLDIREPHELAISALSGSLDIPMGSVPERLDELPADATIAVLCRTGNRSMKVTMWLRQQGYDGATNVGGGINAWAERIDPSLPQY